MTPRQLSYFVQIAQSRSFTRAAAILHVAQPALSRQIQQLEDELGVALLKRSDAGVSLTDAGELLRGKALVLLDQFERVKEEVGSLSALPRGRLRVGLPPSMFDLVTAPVVQEFQRCFPDVTLEVTEGVSASLHELALAGRIDFAVVSSTESRVGLDREELLQERMYLIGSPDTPLLRVDGPLRVADLEGIPLVLTQRPNAIRMILEEALAAVRTEGRVMLESSSTRLALAMVEASAACAVLPYCAVAARIGSGRLVARAVEALNVTWVLVHPRDRALSAAAQQFRHMMFDFARIHHTEGRWPGIVSIG
ncbi:MAG: LysR family transcriptional regulator [Variovorax sp.]